MQISSTRYGSFLSDHTFLNGANIPFSSFCFFESTIPFLLGRGKEEHAGGPIHAFFLNRKKSGPHLRLGRQY